MGLFSPGGGGKRQRRGIRKRARQFASFENFQGIFQKQKALIRESIASGLGPQFQTDQSAALARSGLGQGSVLGRQLQSAIAGAPAFFASAQAGPAAERFQSQQIQTELGLLGAVDPAESSIFDNVVQASSVAFPAIAIAQQLRAQANKLSGAAGPGVGGALSLSDSFGGLAP